MRPLRVDRVAVAVEDVDRAAAWFDRMFGIGFRLDDEATKQVRVAKSDAGVVLVEDTSPEGEASPVRRYWNGGLVSLGMDVPEAELEARKDELVEKGMRVWNYVEMETGFRQYAFEPVDGILVTLFAYPGDSWTEACAYGGDDPLVDRILPAADAAG